MNWGSCLVRYGIVAIGKGQAISDVLDNRSFKKMSFHSLFTRHTTIRWTLTISQGHGLPLHDHVDWKKGSISKAELQVQS